MIETTVEFKTYQNAGNPEVIRWVKPDDFRILDLGCGAGDNARILSLDGRSIDGVTLSPKEAALASAMMRHVEVFDLEKGLPASLTGPYDLVIASHVLEHLCFPAKLLKDVREAMSPSGRLIVALPNLLNYKYRFKLLFGRFEYESGGIMDNTHFRWYTFESAKRLLENAGFSVCHAYADGHLPLWPLRRYLPNRFLGFIDSLVCRLFPGLFGVQLIYVAAKSQTK